VKPLIDARVAVVGLGLMGGSLAGALRGRCRDVVGVARRTTTLEIAQSRGLIDRGTTDLIAGLAAADAVVVAVPVRAILRLLDQIAPLLQPDCLLMDVGSTKAEIARQMAVLPDHVQPLGGHPLCGREVSGVTAADPGLYKEKLFVLTPLSRTSSAALQLGTALVEAVGARVMVLDPERHDRLLAVASHLPYLVACALVGTGQSEAASDAAIWDVAASGFRDTSRLAASDVTMMLDILMTNREAVLATLDAYRGQLDVMAGLIRDADEDALRSMLAALREQRKEIWLHPC
jgi:prephenate dehydrogenase